MTRPWLRAAVVLAAVLAHASWHVAAHVPPYARAEWRHWTDEDRDGLDTRREVLLEERLRADDGTPYWRDPYSGEVHTAARGLDVDHVVPLGWAHAHGGWAWSRARKQAYANDLSDPDHLMAVAASLNRQKGDKGPDRWLPPDARAHCRYGRAWDGVVRRWELSLTATEWDAIRRLTDTCVPGQ